MIVTVTKLKSTFLPLEIKGKKVVMRWNVQELSDNLVKCSEDSLYISHTYSYNQIVTSLIRFRYSLDEELALVNNYQWDSEKYKDEYTEFQEWRNTCKEAAKLYLASKDSNASV